MQIIKETVFRIEEFIKINRFENIEFYLTKKIILYYKKLDFFICE